MVVVVGGLVPDTPPSQTLTRKFSKSKKSSWSLGVVVVGGLVPDTPPPPPPQTLTRKFSKSKRSSWSLGVVVGGTLNITSTISGTFYIWEDD